MVAVSISTLKPGTSVRLGLPRGVDGEVLRDLAAIRLLPGEVVTVVEVVGGAGPIIVQGSGGTYALGRRLAAHLTGEVLE